MVKDRMAVLTALMDQGVIPVFYHPDVEVCKKVIQACANGGAKCIEFTNRGDFAAHVFLDVTRHFAKANDLRADIINARLWGGVHYRTSTEAGVDLGRSVAKYDLKHAFEAVP